MGIKPIRLAVCTAALCAFAAQPSLAKKRDRTLNVRYTPGGDYGQELSGAELKAQKKVLGVWITKSRAVLKNGAASFSFRSTNWKNFRVQLVTKADDRKFVLRDKKLIDGAFRLNQDVPETGKKDGTNSVTLPGDPMVDAFFVANGYGLRDVVLLVRDVRANRLELRGSTLELDPRDAQPRRISYAMAALVTRRWGFREGLTPSRITDLLASRTAVPDPFQLALIAYVAGRSTPGAVYHVPGEQRPAVGQVRALGARHPLNVMALFYDLFDGRSGADQVQWEGELARLLNLKQYLLDSPERWTWGELLQFEDGELLGYSELGDPAVFAERRAKLNALLEENGIAFADGVVR